MFEKFEAGPCQMVLENKKILFSKFFFEKMRLGHAKWC